MTTHFDPAAIHAAATTYVTEIKAVNENTMRERARTQKIVNCLRITSVALSYLGAFCDGIVAGNKR